MTDIKKFFEAARSAEYLWAMSHHLANGIQSEDEYCQLGDRARSFYDQYIERQDEADRYNSIQVRQFKTTRRFKDAIAIEQRRGKRDAESILKNYRES